MDNMHIPLPTVCPIEDGEFVTIPSASWNVLCTSLNRVAQVVNAHSDALQRVLEALGICDAKVAKNSEDISKLAEIIGDIYETLE